MKRQDLVTILAVVVAIAAAGDNIRTKRECAAMLMQEKDVQRLPNGRQVTAKEYAEKEEQLQKMITRYCLIQKWASEIGKYNEQPCPDDGLQLPGVYPQLIYPGAGEKGK